MSLKIAVFRLGDGKLAIADLKTPKYADSWLMSLRATAVAGVAFFLAQSAWSQAAPEIAAAEHRFKLTVGAYHASGGGLPSGPGLDLNLRYSYGSGNVWIGWFRSPAWGVSQPRAGWDHVFPLGPVRVLPSLQIASGGFVGGSLALETGDSWFVGAGLGRTNLRNYANLNFDPNDSYTVYGGYRWPDETAVSALLVRDNRLNPDQQHVHFVYRRPLPDGDRLTLDLLHKQGTVDGIYVRRIGASITYDWPRWFVRAAWDPKVNFTAQDMVRFSVGTRF